MIRLPSATPWGGKASFLKKLIGHRLLQCCQVNTYPPSSVHFDWELGDVDFSHSSPNTIPSGHTPQNQVNKNSPRMLCKQLNCIRRLSKRQNMRDPPHTQFLSLENSSAGFVLRDSEVWRIAFMYEKT